MGGYRELAQRLVGVALNKQLGDIPQPVVFRSMSPGAYNPTTGVAGATFGSTAVARALLARFDAKDIDGNVVKPTDQKVLIAAVDLPGVAPKTADKIGISGVDWLVQRVLLDPTGALHVLHVRRPA